MSGSFVVAGSGAYRATKVGHEAYAAKLAEEASKFTLVNSELRSGINKILQFITYLLIPAGLLIIYTQLFTTDAGWRESVLRMVGRIGADGARGPGADDLYRVRRRRGATRAQAVPRQRIARDRRARPGRRGVRRQDGHADRERHAGIGSQAALPKRPSATSWRQLASDDARPNASMQAIAEAYKMPPGWTATATAPFKSATKWSGASYGEHGNWVIGAPDVLLEPGSPVAEEAERIGSLGLRVLLLGSSDLPVDHPYAPGTVTPVALVVLEQRIRPDARDTLDYFASQKVSIKVISGDNAVSVGAVAGSLGLEGETMDARKLPDQPDKLADTLEEYTTFGRVRPDQKRAMVHALQSRGHTVAMTGDGVNDVLALKDADIGVAMGSGSSASRAVAQIVLLDNKFATLPYVVGEGRRVIGNIERVSNLFLTKTVYSVLLAVLVGLAGLASKIFGSDPLPFPFQPIHVTIAAWFTIGIPAFILSLAPEQRTGAPRLRAAGDDVLRCRRGSSSASRRSPPTWLAYQGREATADPADAGVDGGADHAAGDGGVGAGRGGAAVPVVAGGAGGGVGSGVRGDLLAFRWRARRSCSTRRTSLITSMALAIGLRRSGRRSS